MLGFKSPIPFSLIAILLLTFFAGSSFAQSDSLLKKVSCDCDSAIKIDVFRKAFYGFTQAPEGYGKLQEIKANARTLKTAFEQEHHTAWYLLEIKAIDGELAFDITPKNQKDDYDFLLFPYKDSSSCADILNEKIKPLRGNLSRNDTNNKSITGLSGNVTNEFHGEGIGAQFSKSINVKKGEKYLLVLDNVYANGSGHKINFHFVKEVQISGQVRDDAGKPLVSEITLYDDKGQEVIKTNSNTNGNYEMKPKLNENVDYSLNFTADSSFVAAETINTKNLKDSNSFANIKTVLPKLKKGKKYPIKNLNFFGDSPKLVPRSTPSLIALYQVMKKNKEMNIQIEGHINGGELSKSTPSYKQSLSEQRTETVYNYLVEKGIDAKRMSKIGFSDRFMIYPKPMNDYEHEANRRVEIKVVSLNQND